MAWGFVDGATIIRSVERANCTSTVTASDILGNPDYKGIAYSGYRGVSREQQPTLAEIKEDLRILHAMNIRVLKTFDVHYPHAANVLKAIEELKEEDRGFEMYVMLGTWINCKHAETPGVLPDHSQEDLEFNTEEIDKAVGLINRYPEIVKMVSVGSEAMVHWAESYYVQPEVILKWVNYLQALKREGRLPKDLWVTASDNFASWGGGDTSYHGKALDELIRAVDFISMHTYPYLDTHYQPVFWGQKKDEEHLPIEEKLEKVMSRAVTFAQSQYDAVAQYVKRVDPLKPIHIGETGWATVCEGFFGDDGSQASDELKQALYYQKFQLWCREERITCFYFEAFDEPWKDAVNPAGEENHFGLFTVEGKAKYVIWSLIDEGAFDGLRRGGNPIVKTFDGDTGQLVNEVLVPPVNYALSDQE